MWITFILRGPLVEANNRSVLFTYSATNGPSINSDCNYPVAKGQSRKVQRTEAIGRSNTNENVPEHHCDNKSDPNQLNNSPISISSNIGNDIASRYLEMKHHDQQVRDLELLITHAPSEEERSLFKKRLFEYLTKSVK